MNDWEDLKEEQYTAVYKDGVEIDRLEGHVALKPKDYAERLPVEVHHITVETIRIMKFEK